MIRFADDIAVIAESEEDLQANLQIMGKIFKECKIKINKKKTEVMVTGKDTVQRDIRIDGTKLKQVNFLKNLESRITADARRHRRHKV